MPSVGLLEHHLIYKPRRNRQSIGGNAGNNGNAGPANTAGVGDFYYLKLTTEISKGGGQNAESTSTGASSTGASHKESDQMEVDPVPNFKDAAPSEHKVRGSIEADAVDSYDVRKQKWTMRFSDLPEVNGKRPVTSRMMHQATVQDGDALAFVDSLGYMLVSEFVLSGSYVVYHNIYITLTRTLLPLKPFSPFPMDSCCPLDPVDAYILQASIKVFSANEQETMNKGVEELKILRNELRGVVDLEPGDRLSLDTRVR
ncbi:hypothetical protein H072_10874 [Dactylellina haptotyla CBS 200.50]|uniref:Mediator of RNA polymerase II transcription subunit 18 n=1 Tax=Dactylellina haptotyla (strain CBS 200.50) TaxID=1284197 RepID=S8A3J4_DACHA|nr:hypothetical protein H072_10874 [Dactylellina haptotyla CBS 200.50]